MKIEQIRIYLDEQRPLVNRETTLEEYTDIKNRIYNLRTEDKPIKVLLVSNSSDVSFEVDMKPTDIIKVLRTFVQ